METKKILLFRGGVVHYVGLPWRLSYMSRLEKKPPLGPKCSTSLRYRRIYSRPAGASHYHGIRGLNGHAIRFVRTPEEGE